MPTLRLFIHGVTPRRTLRKTFVRKRSASIIAQREPLRPRPQPKKQSLKRKMVLWWKRISRPSKPRQSGRFSFVPEDFVLVTLPATWSGSERRSRLWERNEVGY
ncbi:hypothetical protein BDN71DRAFT_1441795 [Pleurotus eryngii]|uniref:Uncharacterized protein n=1 Tax=Pleurotus eryngii TaxID=5323 RepID=A0A9P6A3Y5_PLEER|nr:hypothetical protein BDN71DRAFT_1441795 [Pleurotus eryngii]